MPRVLVVHGAGMNMRGKVQVDIFGPMTLPEYDERIRGYAKELGVDVEIFHSNVEGEIVNRLFTANDERFDANDDLTAVLTAGQEFQVKLRLGERKRQAKIVADARDRPWTWALDAH